MQYFTRDLWRSMNESDKEERRRAEKQWCLNIKKYKQYIRSLEDRDDIAELSKAMESFEYFHDYDVQAVLYDRNQNQLVFFLNSSRVRIRLCLGGVKKFYAEMGDVQAKPTNLRWGYHEMEMLDEKTVRFSVVFDFENEMEIMAESIELSEVT